MIAHRKSKGSTVFLVSLIICIIGLVALCGIGFDYLLFMRAKAQYEADAFALSLATKINIGDRIGECNQLQDASRQLIFVSRQYCDQCSEGCPHALVGLCDQLLQDARFGHSLVEGERQNQISLIRKEVQDAVVAYNQGKEKSDGFTFLGVKTFEPQIVRADLGRIAKVDCNVRAVDALPELRAFDLNQAYCDKTSKLYKCEVNAKLPAYDADLDFSFSSLPAYVSKTSAPSRNTNAGVFVPYNTIFADDKIINLSAKQIPSAIQIFQAMNVTLPWDQSKIVPIRLIATSIACGASSDSK